MRSRVEIGSAITLIGSLAALGAALASQYAFAMPPCAWCVLQRLIFLVIAAASALALLSRRPRVRATLGAIIFLLAASGVASALYQHFVAARSDSCRLSFAERIVSGTLHLDALLPAVFEIRVACGAGRATMLGIPYEFWSLAAYALLAATVVWWSLSRFTHADTDIALSVRRASESTREHRAIRDRAAPPSAPADRS